MIYFTFGSVVKMSTLPDNIKNAFKEALSRMPQRVLWKYEGEMKDVPKNVMIKKWFPQREILRKIASVQNRMSLWVKIRQCT